MSYDVMAGGETFNHTSNQRRMFRDFGMSIPEMHGRDREEVAAEIGVGLRRLVRERDKDRVAFDARYDTPGPDPWGTARTGMSFLLGIFLACTYELPDTVAVW